MDLLELLQVPGWAQLGWLNLAGLTQVPVLGEQVLPALEQRKEALLQVGMEAWPLAQEL